MEKDVQKDRPFLLMQSFWELEKAIMRHVKQTATHNDLSVPQFCIIVTMQHRKQMAQKKLQARTHFPKSTLSHAIEGLVQAGLLERAYVEGNRREMDLLLTDRGKVLLEDIQSQEDGVHMRFKYAVNSFTDDQFSDLIH